MEEQLRSEEEIEDEEIEEDEDKIEIEGELLDQLRPLGEREEGQIRHRAELLEKVESEEILERKTRYLNGEIDEVVCGVDLKKEQALRKQLAAITENDRSLKTEIAAIDAEISHTKDERSRLVVQFAYSSLPSFKDGFIEAIDEIVSEYENRLVILESLADRFGVREKLNPSFFLNDARFFDEKDWRKVRDRLTYLFGFQG